MRKSYYLVYSLILSAFLSQAQILPEYNNSAIAWNSKANIAVPLTPEETIRKDKMNSAYKIPYGALFSKKAAMKTIMQLQGPRSKARISSEDTLKIFAKIDKDTDPKGVIKIYKANIENNNREVNAMQVSKKGEVERSDGDYSYSLRKVSQGVFRLDVIGTKPGDELLLYIGTHEMAVAKLTLGID